MEIREIIPDPDDLLALDVEELAGILLVHLNAGGGGLHHYNFFIGLRSYPVYGDRNPARDEQVNRALMEAWDWLANEGLLARQDEDSTKSMYFVTRRGQRLKSREEFIAYRKANLLPKQQLHPVIASKVYPPFLLGEYDTAIFQAFREIEMAVREAGGFSAADHGTDLMRTAFRVLRNSGTAGPLTDTSLPIGEQEAMGHLFAGAFGLYRNSTAHRYVPTKPEEAVEVIMFASQLLRIVDRLRLTQCADSQPSLD